MTVSNYILDQPNNRTYWGCVLLTDLLHPHKPPMVISLVEAFREERFRFIPSPEKFRDQESEDRGQTHGK